MLQAAIYLFLEFKNFPEKFHIIKMNQSNYDEKRNKKFEDS